MISRREFLKTAIRTGAGGAVLSLAGTSACRASRTKPNIILILADDLGCAQLGCYGEKKIRTPEIDKLATEGTRFTQAYSGSPVCAPSRCVLLTGQHTGHAHIRDNREIMPEGQEPLPAGTPTLPRLLQREGYTTGLVGKWGLGFPGSPGEPLEQGFDFFFGYNCQRKAYNHYPPELWRNAARVSIEGNDRSPVGRILALLRELRLEQDTLILFSSDNGPTYDVGGYDMAFFGGAGPLPSSTGCGRREHSVHH